MIVNSGIERHLRWEDIHYIGSSLLLLALDRSDQSTLTLTSLVDVIQETHQHSAFHMMRVSWVTPTQDLIEWVDSIRPHSMTFTLVNRIGGSGLWQGGINGSIEWSGRALGSWKAIGCIVNKVFLNVGIVDSSRRPRAWSFHYNIKHSCTGVCWIGLEPMFRNLSSDRYQDTCRTNWKFWWANEYNCRQSSIVWICVGCVWWWLEELFDSCPVANISPPLLHPFVGIHKPPTATICRNHW